MGDGSKKLEAGVLGRCERPIDERDRDFEESGWGGVMGGQT